MLKPITAFFIRFFCFTFFTFYIILKFYSFDIVQLLLWKFALLTGFIGIFFAILLFIKTQCMRDKFLLMAQSIFSPFKQFKDELSYKKAIQVNTNRQLKKLTINPQYIRYKKLKIITKNPDDFYLYKRKDEKEMNQAIKFLENLEVLIYAQDQIKKLISN